MRVVAIWLDGFDMALADRFELPVLAQLRDQSAWATLDNGSDHLTGLSGEHLATGLDPRASGRASAVRFHPDTYACRQEPTALQPIYGAVPTVVFDPCYFDLEAAPETVEGITDWGSHDPGGPGAARPGGLRAEVEQRFGAYPAKQWLYATPWASAEACSLAGTHLTNAVRARSEIAKWLLGERCTDWELAFVGVSEAHSATEGLFHGVDPSPRWAQCASRAAAAAGLRSVYTAIDQMVGELVEAFPDDVHLVFSQHGMGANNSDVASMVLLGELLARWAGEHTPDLSFPVDSQGLPVSLDGQGWEEAVWTSIDGPPSVVRRSRQAVRRLAGRAVRRMVPRLAPSGVSVGWMPVVRHQSRWSTRRAFAIPSFYDGRVRLNVRGREAKGLVSASEYGATLDEIEALLRECTDPISGAPVVEAIHRTHTEPNAVDPTDADLLVTWAPEVYGISHPLLGTIGPIPQRRTGGHTSPIGRLMAHGPGITPRHIGTRSSFDVVPTVFDLTGSVPPWTPSGTAMPLR